MSLFITSLNSGSNGNCYYIANDNEAVLIDAGISCLEFEKRMSRLGLPVSKLKAIFISHEHTDHIYGVAMISKKYRLPVYITTDTCRHGSLRLHEDLCFPFYPFLPVQIGSLTIKAFPKTHDACDPHSFIVASSAVTVGIFTDIGQVCKQVTDHFRKCHAAFLESNYDEQMLIQGRYPYFLKNRIRGGQGHLSNIQALQLFREHRPAFMSHLLLSHLSKENNSPHLVYRLFEQHAEQTKIVIASRYVETPVFRIDPESTSETSQQSNSLREPLSPEISINITRRSSPRNHHTQLSLFE